VGAEREAAAGEAGVGAACGVAAMLSLCLGAVSPRAHTPETARCRARSAYDSCAFRDPARSTDATRAASHPTMASEPGPDAAAPGTACRPSDPPIGMCSDICKCAEFRRRIHPDAYPSLDYLHLLL